MQFYWILVATVFFGAGLGARGVGATQKTFKYRNVSGAISINSDSSVFRSSKHTVTMNDCSDAYEVCYAFGNDSLSIPIKCPLSIVDRYSNDERFRVVGYVHDTVTVKPINSDAIMFSYSTRLGLTAIYWDYKKSGALRDRGDGLGIDRVLAERFVFLPKRSTETLTCEHSR